MSLVKDELKRIVPSGVLDRWRRSRRWKQNLVARAYRTRYANPDFRRWDGPAVFLVGSARSGTTLLSNVLDAGVGIDNFGEPPETFQSRFGLSVFDRRFLGLTSIDAIREELLESRLPLLNEGRIYVEKWPGNAFLVRELHSVFPNARFVHIVRDGRAVADSAFRRYGGEWLTGSLNIFTNLAMNREGFDSTLPMMARGGLRWRLQVEAAIEAFDALPPESAYTLRYEDLQKSPEQTVEALFRFVGARYDAERVPEIRISERRPWEGWPDEDKEAFKRVAGDLMERMDYASNEDW